MKSWRARMGLWLSLLVVGFLLGFVPEYLKNRDLQVQLESPQKALNALRRQIQVAELRDAAGLMYMELSRENYGLAREHANQYQNSLKDLILQTQDEALKKSLQELSAALDSLTITLTTPNSAAVAAAQMLLLRTFEVTKDSRWGQLSTP